MLRSCPNVNWSWIGDDRDDGFVRVGRVQIDFGFSFDAALTIDMVLYFKV